MVTAPLGSRLHLRLRLMLARHRRVVIAVLLALGVASALSALRPSSPAPATAQVPVTRRDLPAGHRPATAGRSGDVPPGRVVVAVRLSDPASSLLTAPGDHVQVISGPPLDPVSGAAIGAVPGGRSGEGTGAARVVVQDALVLEVPSSGGQATAAASSRRGGLLGGALAPAGARSLDDVPETGAAGSLPEGVLAVAVLPDDALDLAAVTGVRSLSVARLLPRPG